MGLPGAGSSGLCRLPVRRCWGTAEPAERGAIDQVPRQGPQCGRDAAQLCTEDASTEQWGYEGLKGHPEAIRMKR